MRSAFIFPTVVICVSSVLSQQPFVRYSENLRKAVPNHYNNDKENPHRRSDKVAWGHKVEPRQPPLRPEPSIPWLRWVQQGRLAAHADRNTELHKVRARLLEQKLKPNQLAFKPRINPQQKPDLKPVERNRIKREIHNGEIKMEAESKTRHKRDISMTHVKPENIQPLDTKISGQTEQLGGKVQMSEKREKRQILYFINSPAQLMPRAPRTTPNPFIRDTHIEAYDIIRPEVGEREGMIPTVETGSSDPGSYPLVSETSDLEYESDYTISMSDSEEWHNYPLTTPSGPNPGWHLSTLADIYQKQRKTQYQVLKPVKTSEIKSIIQVWPDDKPLIRAKRSPKERKRKIGAYKEKIKQRRKLKDIRRKRRIIRNSKEDKAVKESLKDENAIERLLHRPRVFPRQTAYQIEDTSREILWTNGTHNIVEDPDATVKWINETHYVVYREQDNSTNEWYHKHHVLLYNDEWENKTSEEKRAMTIGAPEEETVEVKVKEEKTKAGKTAVKKKGVKKKGGKRLADKKAPKPKIKSKKSKKIMTVKNVNEAPRDPRRDPSEKKVVKDSSMSEEKKKKKKKRIKTKEGKEHSKENKKLESSIDIDMSKSREKKKKRVKSKDKKDISGSKEKRKKKERKIKSLEDNLSEKKKKKSSMESDEKKINREIKMKKRKRKTKEVDKSIKPTKEKKKNKEKEIKSMESSKISREERKRKKKDKKKVDVSASKEDENSTRKKRSIYRSDEFKTAEVRWEKVQKSEYDGWQVFGQDDKSEVYDVSYELIETKNITKKH